MLRITSVPLVRVRPLRLDDVDDYGVDDEISSIEIDNLAKNFRN